MGTKVEDGFVKVHILLLFMIHTIVQKQKTNPNKQIHKQDNAS